MNYVVTAWNELIEENLKAMVEQLIEKEQFISELEN